MPPYDIRSTPNPDSLKFEARDTQFVESGMITASSIEEAADNELAGRLCSIDGVANVFILPQFLTITKSPDADWDGLLPAIEELLTAQLT
ncbi:MAG: NifU N-terminal domain-containing protein [Rhodothermia bacterium]|nr:NifU N-terminal domain-containing protein [Rhodothermia bacterium]